MVRLDRRQFLQGSLAAAGLITGCGGVSFPGQRPARLRRIGYLESGTAEAPENRTASTMFESFREGMRELGYIEGQNLLIEYRSAEGNAERLPSLAADLVSLPVEVIVTSQPAAALAANQGTSPIPIVASGGNLIAASGTSIARPGGPITGVTTNSVEAVGKW